MIFLRSVKLGAFCLKLLLSLYKLISQVFNATRMVEWECSPNGNRRFVAELLHEWDGLVMEGVFVPNEYSSGGQFVVVVKDDENQERLGRMALNITGVGVNEEGLLEVRMSSKKYADIPKALRGEMLCMSIFSMMKFWDADCVVFANGVRIDRDSDFFKDLEDNFSKGKMEKFFDEGEADLKGGLKFNVGLSPDGTVTAKVFSPDGDEGYLQGLISETESGFKELVVYEMVKYGYQHWLDMEKKNRLYEETQLAEVVGQVMNKKVSRREESQSSMANLDTVMIYLTARFLRHNLKSGKEDLGIVLCIDGCQEMFLDEEIMTGQISEWLGF